MADPVATNQPISVPSIVSVGELSNRLGLPAARVITELIKNGVMATINEDIDYETAAIIAADLGFEVVPEEGSAPEEPVAKAEGDIRPRPPIVAVMGHVDHGKTSLLDAIRESNVATGEAGGITQHIGAYQVKKGERMITFLDTPGHEAFHAMRAHGARITDVVIVVVAADDGVKPQTREAIQLAREGGAAIVVAVNKIDAEGADPTRVRQQLVEEGLVPEGWGGQTVTVDVSAKTGEGIDQLLEMVLLVSDVEELTARYDGLAHGVVVESHLHQAKGPVATVIVQAGTLNVGDAVAVGAVTGKIRAMEDFRGKRYKYADPATPVSISGLKAVPEPGETVQEFATEREAKAVASQALREKGVKRYSEVKKIGAAELTAAVKAGEVSELAVVLKADVQGSLEAVRQNLEAIKHPEVAVKIIGEGVGDVTENDVSLAAASGGIILGFNVSLPAPVAGLAKQQSVTVSLYTVIYELAADVRSALEGLLAPEEVRVDLAEALIKGVFRRTKGQVITGGLVTSGTLERGAMVEVFRGEERLGEGRLVSIRREAEDVKEAASGTTVGFVIEPGIALEIGDTLKAYRIEERKRTL
jgi:translation initiation factor IF-2